MWRATPAQSELLLPSGGYLGELPKEMQTVPKEMQTFVARKDVVVLSFVEYILHQSQDAQN